MLQPVSVTRSSAKDPSFSFGPLPGLRDGDVLAYEFALPERFVPWPDRTNVDRTFVLLDLGVSFTQPCWQYVVEEDGTRTPGVDAESTGDRAWYVDLVEVTGGPDDFTITDLYVDVIVACDGRGHRMLDLEELADAMAQRAITTEQGIDGLRRWQAFLDRHLYAARDPRHGWRDFPPRAIQQLQDVPGLLGEMVTWEG